MRGDLSTCYTEIDPEESRSIWDGYLPLNEVALGAGEGGIGKGLWVADIVGRVTRGDFMPDLSESDLSGPKNVVLVTPEDHIRRTMAWRLRAAGADLKRVFDLTTVLGHAFTIPDHLPLLEQEIDEIGGVGLVVIDPLSQCVDKNLTGVRFVRRQVWAPMREIAEEHDLCMLGMHHLTKSGSVAGSAALVQAARMQLKFTRNEMDPTLVELKVAKANLKAGEPVYYRQSGEDHEITIEYTELDITPAEMGQMRDTARAVVCYLQRNGEAHYRKVAENCGLSDANARVLLHRLAARGLVVKIQRGVYCAVEAA